MNAHEYIPSSSPSPDINVQAGHRISRALNGEFAQGVVQRPCERPFRAWSTWRFLTPEGVRLDRATHYYGWWQLLELYELDSINLATGHPSRSFSLTDDERLFQKRFLYGKLYRIINPPSPPDFNPSHIDLNEIWPGVWAQWFPWIERAAEFDWRSHASEQCYVKLSGQSESKEAEWDNHLRRVPATAAHLVDGTSYSEWIKLLRALCRFEVHLAETERSLLRLLVHEIIWIVSNLLRIAYDKTIPRLAIDHDGSSRPRPGFNAFSFENEDVRPGNLLRILNERRFITEGDVRRTLEYHFKELQARLVEKLPDDCSSSLFAALATIFNEPILTALAAYEKATKPESAGSFRNQHLWSAVRALVVACESEYRRWFDQENLHKSLEEAFTPAQWKKSWERFQSDYPCAKKGKLDCTDKFLAVLASNLAKIDQNLNNPVNRLDWHQTILYFSRNWAAHNGENPHPSGSNERLGSLVVTSAIRSMFIMWDSACSNEQYRLNLDRIYPEAKG